MRFGIITIEMIERIKSEFDFVGDWACMLADGSSPSLEVERIRHLGPVCELARALSQFQNVSIAGVALPFETRTTRGLVHASEAGRSISFKEGIGALGFLSFQGCQELEEADKELTSFIDDACAKCEEIGIPKKMAQASTGALEEMSNNAVAHSMKLQSTVIGFRAQRHLFEFVTFDAGIGILASLKHEGFHASLADEAEALELAITDGVSCHGPGKGHGNGFRQIFNMPNNHAGYFWLHSGEHALVVDGGTLDRPEAHIRQLNQARGVLVSAAFLV